MIERWRLVASGMRVLLVDLVVSVSLVEYHLTCLFSAKLQSTAFERSAIALASRIVLFSAAARLIIA